jgi:formylglycine-generating enzyme required for sulfatase activity
VNPKQQIQVCGQMIEGKFIPAGTFIMGSTQGLNLEQPVHVGQIAAPFWMGKLPVTQAQWFALMRNNPSEFQGTSELPVENVSWDDCQIFCAKLSEMTGWHVRLPAESEWEYACRAGS